MNKKKLVSNKRKNRKSVKKIRKRIILSTNMKNMISIILPLVTIFVIGFILRGGLTGLAVYETNELYWLNGSVSIEFWEVPLDSYVKIRVDNHVMKVNLIDFLEIETATHHRASVPSSATCVPEAPVRRPYGARSLVAGRLSVRARLAIPVRSQTRASRRATCLWRSPSI